MEDTLAQALARVNSDSDSTGGSSRMNGYSSIDVNHLEPAQYHRSKSSPEPPTSTTPRSNQEYNPNNYRRVASTNYDISKTNTDFNPILSQSKKASVSNKRSKASNSSVSKKSTSLAQGQLSSQSRQLDSPDSSGSSISDVDHIDRYLQTRRTEFSMADSTTDSFVNVTVPSRRPGSASQSMLTMG